MTNYADRGLEIIRYLKRHGIISMNGFGSFPKHHLESIAKLGAGEFVEEPFLLPSELAYACIHARKRAKRGAMRYRLGSYWFTVLDEKGIPTNKKTTLGSITFPDLNLHLAFSGKKGWYWKEYNEESLMLLLIDSPEAFKDRKTSYKIQK